MKKQPIEPDRTEVDKAFRLCCASKSGSYVNPDDIAWVHKFYQRYEGSKALENWGQKIFNATKPFGA